MKKLVIAMDGPAGAGKSTIAKLVSQKLNIEYIDTGAMYRAITLKMINKNVDEKNLESIINIAKETKIEIRENKIFLDNIDVSEEIRTPQISERVSYFSAIKEIRYILVELQRNIAKDTNVIMDGRDIGSYVFPNANLKIYLQASIEERTNRRFKELFSKNFKVDYETLKEEIKRRDEMDSRREFAPLIKAKDAIEVDTTGKNIDCVVNEIIDLIGKVIEK